ncbi:uncharacterized protein SPPG_05582 [Spizellomyces punctatus DAOM BR117]|uniref:UspA domain-containing protein n=1 Tax=Spizellomyces punctatus (strain DAOM BR117) TaxID=645134 RepID=A0A0L0HEC5_SPIPD|nr:uncharacterized protein SPPG_05582 [Spizellomyces punctatus DAOM BR117]KNC99334.1 hypothetical protein SPPG_05582 [Spizellomyces punctatus DAOM BR117]|eukprot:XP_016607374.1 hypothetical protein SPPG_05582 [Spizellomyces punctatus DAOM BR117]
MSAAFATPGNRTIIIGVDSITKHGIQSSPVLAWSLRQFLVPGDSITVVHASKQLDSSAAGHSGYTNVMTPEMLKTLERDVESVVREMCRNFFAAAKEEIKVKASVVKGDPREVIKGLANDINATAVIVGRRGSVGAVKRVLLGSVSDYLARELNSTVIIVKGE